MVARRGNAPRSAGCEPVALLLSYQANEEVAPAPGNAPRFAAPAAMRLPLRVCDCAHPREAFLVENQACCYCTMRASVSLARIALASDPLGEDRSKSVELQGREKSGAPRTRTLDTDEGATVFKTASSTDRTRSVCEMAPPLGIAPSSHRLTGGPHTLCVERNCSRQELHLRRSV